MKGKFHLNFLIFKSRNEENLIKDYLKQKMKFRKSSHVQTTFKKYFLLKIRVLDLYKQNKINSLFRKRRQRKTMFLKLKLFQYNFSMFQNHDLLKGKNKIYMENMGKVCSSVQGLPWQEWKGIRGYLNNMWNKCQTFFSGTMRTICVY